MSHFDSVTELSPDFCEILEREARALGIERDMLGQGTIEWE